MTRPRSPTQSEIEHILYSNDIDFANFIDYHFGLSPTLQGEVRVGAEYTAGNGNTTPTPPPSDTSDTSTDTWVDRLIYMYYHPVGQIWLPYPPEGVPRAEDLHAVEEDRQGKEVVGSSKNFLDRLVDLGIRTLVSVKRRRIETREESAGRPKRVGRKLTKKRPVDGEEKRAGRKLTKSRPEGEDGRTM
jgi:hypothetical protein